MDTIILYTVPQRPDEIINSLIHCCKDYTHKVHKNYEIHQGMYKNMTCKFNGHSFKIIGSISKLFQGSNQFDVDTYDTKNVIEELSVVFNLDFNQAICTRLDYAENLLMNHETGKYIDILSIGATGKSFRISDETYYIKKAKKTIIVYDKIEELKNAKVPLHPDLVGKFILRLEVRWFKTLHQLLDVPKLTFGMLADQRIINKIKQLWAAEILSLNFKHVYLPNINFSSIKTFESSLASYGILAIGGLDTIKEELNRQKNLTSQQKYRLANKLKEINTHNASDTTRLLVEELLEKVKLAVDSHKDIYRMLPYGI